jgi:hypothetical protein
VSHPFDSLNTGRSCSLAHMHVIHMQVRFNFYPDSDSIDGGPVADIEQLSADLALDSLLRADRERLPKASSIPRRRAAQELTRCAGEEHAGLDSDTPFFERWEQSKFKVRQK